MNNYTISSKMVNLISSISEKLTLQKVGNRVGNKVGNNYWERIDEIQ